MSDYLRREIFWAKMGEGTSWMGAAALLLLTGSSISGSPHPKLSVTIFIVMCIAMPALITIMRRARMNLMPRQTTPTSA